MLKYATPVRDLSFYADYFNAYQSIVIDEDRLAKRRFQAHQTILLLQSIHFLHLSLSHTELSRVVLYDVVYALLNKVPLNIAAFAVTTVGVYINHLFYCTVNHSNNCLLRDIVLRKAKTNRFFIYAKNNA